MNHDVCSTFHHFVGESSPALSALDSSSHLILVHDDDDDGTPLDFSLDDHDDDDAVFDVGRPYVLPLGPSVVLLYLLSPFLKLGALLLPHTKVPLKFGLPAFFLFAVLAAFTRRIWYMLSRYLRKSDLEDVVLEETVRMVLRTVVRGGTGGLRVLLASLYLRDSIDVLVPLFPSDLVLAPDLVLTIIVAVVLFPLSLGQSLGSKRTIYCTGFSVITFVLWLALVSIAHAKGTLKGLSSSGALWQGITTIAFTFTSSTTLPLYASLKASLPTAVTTAKSPKSHSFMILSIISVALAVILTLPLMFFSAFPNRPRVQDITVYPLEPFIAPMNALTLLLGIPSVLATSPSLPIPERVRQSTTIPLSRLGIFILVLIFALLPGVVFAVISDIVLVCALLSTYFLPALVHITAHYLKRPLSIIMPPSTPNPYAQVTSPTAHDELLQRKERALQRKQLKKRIIWDLGVWFLLLPVGCGGGAWAVGHLAGKW
ncbi:hypothetical protein BDZ89DRAFT_1095401 [Hymenopellis radicata]|nr:hypothetical protein BDZ89DRAFT_1095401 [Hymenopellis radicata]